MDNYENFRAIGEVVLDATSTPKQKLNSLILHHMPCIIRMRNSEGYDFNFDGQYYYEPTFLKTSSKWVPFPGYNKNLTKIGD